MANIVKAIDLSRMRGLPGGVRNHLRQMYTPGNGNAEFQFRNSPDLVLVEDHFIKALDTALWTTTADAGTTAFAHQVATRGRLFCTLDGGDEEGCGIHGTKVQWYGDQDCGMCVIFKLDAITNIRFEAGLTTVPSDVTLPIAGDPDTPTVGNGGTDVAIVGMDTTETLTTMWFITEGSTASMNVTKTDLGTLTPTADTYMGIKVFAKGDNFTAEVFDATPDSGYPVLARASHGDTIASRVEGGTPLTPWFFFQATEAEAKTATIDYMAVWQNR